MSPQTRYRRRICNLQSSLLRKALEHSRVLFANFGRGGGQGPVPLRIWSKSFFSPCPPPRSRCWGSPAPTPFSSCWLNYGFGCPSVTEAPPLIGFGPGGGAGRPEKLVCWRRPGCTSVATRSAAFASWGRGAAAARAAEPRAGG